MASRREALWWPGFRMQTKDARPTIAIAGATGFVGQALIPRLIDDFKVVGLTRSPTRAAMKGDEAIQWRHCDLFSMSAVERALEGVDFALYLVHSMLPSARLTQADFVDLDLLLADNFSRAAETNGVKQIIYIGGIMPVVESPSPHLRSRHEVEQTLSARRTPVTSLRAGLIIGPGGSSFAMLVNLVRRLPVMLLPAWTRGESSPIAIDDVVRAVQWCLGREEAFGQTYDIGGPESMSYHEMLSRTADFLGLRRRMRGVPFVSVDLSRFWVCTVTGASPELVGPLIESLRYSLIPDDNPLQTWLRQDALSFEEALRRSTDDNGRMLPNPRSVIKVKDARRLKVLKTVRSVQRLPLPVEHRAKWAAHEYMRWLPSFVWPLLTCRVSDEGVVRFYVRATSMFLLELSHAPDRSQPDRQLFRITGGLLAKVTEKSSPGRFEFREVLQGRFLIAAIHDFRPALPWFIYNFSQALVHLWVMKGFGRHLAAESSKPQ
ncbi:MAG: NAD(P)H-binding protein [Myxococcota bacterium]